MSSFVDQLTSMLLNQVVQNDPVVFAVGCSIVGVLAVILDFSLYLIQGKSLLNLKHGKNTIVFLFAWAIGAFIMGYIGLIAEIFQVSLMASCVVGFTWPILFTKLLEKLQEKEASLEPEQPIQEEI